MCRARTKQITEARVAELVIHLELTETRLFALRWPDDLTKADDRALAILPEYGKDLDRVLWRDEGDYALLLTCFICDSPT